MATAAGRPASGPARVFRTAEVARILGVAPQRIRAVVRHGLCHPSRQGRAYAFSFQDLVRLRAAHGLLRAQVPPRRVQRALAELTRQLPPDRPLSGVRIYADGRHVVVRDGRTTWQPESGQIVFTFDVDDLARAAGIVIAVGDTRPRKPPRREPPQNALAWFERGLRLERKQDRAGALAAYRRAIDIDPEMADAYINLGRLTHEDGDPTEAARLYHLALGCAPDDAIAHYNLALALEDLRHPAAAISHYRQAITLDAEFADAHFNLGRLLERLGRRTQAIRHLLAYKQLTEGA